MSLVGRVLAEAPRALVLTAPAGYGKSTFVREYAQAFPHAAFCDCDIARDGDGLARAVVDALAAGSPELALEVARIRLAQAAGGEPELAAALWSRARRDGPVRLRERRRAARDRRRARAARTAGGRRTGRPRARVLHAAPAPARAVAGDRPRARRDDRGRAAAARPRVPSSRWRPSTGWASARRARWRGWARAGRWSRGCCSASPARAGSNGSPRAWTTSRSRNSTTTSPTRSSRRSPAPSPTPS